MESESVHQSEDALFCEDRYFRILGYFSFYLSAYLSGCLTLALCISLICKMLLTEGYLKAALSISYTVLLNMQYDDSVTLK